MASSKAAADKVKGSAFGICSFRTILSLLPDEAESLCYDKRTPKFEGVALEFNTDKSEHHGELATLEGCRNVADDFPSLLKRMSGGDKGWGGLDFNVCRAHAVDNLIRDAVAETAEISPSSVQQVVFCGVGQDYRAMRYGEELQAKGVKVFELDLPPMMALRAQVKAHICEVNDDLVLPETYALSIDFNEQSVSDVLMACPSFDPMVPTLYLWEGVSYYLSPEAMESFLRDIHGLMCRAPPAIQRKHSIFFDYLIDLPILAEQGDVSAAAMLEAFADNEALQSFLDFANVGPYLSSLGFRIEQEMIPPAIYKPYQTAKNEDYHLKGSKYFGMVVAKPK